MYQVLRNDDRSLRWNEKKEKTTQRKMRLNHQSFDETDTYSSLAMICLDKTGFLAVFSSNYWSSKMTGDAKYFPLINFHRAIRITGISATHLKK